VNVNTSTLLEVVVPQIWTNAVVESHLPGGRIEVWHGPDGWSRVSAIRGALHVAQRIDHDWLLKGDTKSICNRIDSLIVGLLKAVSRERVDVWPLEELPGPKKGTTQEVE
jgi:hypothetical protein